MISSLSLSPPDLHELKCGTGHDERSVGKVGERPASGREEVGLEVLVDRGASPDVLGRSGRGRQGTGEVDVEIKITIGCAEAIFT
jgi:hypothetical protein